MASGYTKVLATRSDVTKYTVHTTAQTIAIDTITAKVTTTDLVSRASPAESARGSTPSEINPAPTHSDANSMLAQPATSLPPALVVRRGFDLVEGGSSAADFCDDLFGGLVPDEGLGVVVPVFGPDLDGIDEVGHAGEHASA